MNIAKSGFRLTVAHIIKFTLSFVAIAYFARELGAAALGAFFLFQALLDILRLPSNLGIRLAIEKRISEGSAPNKSFTSGVILKILLLVIIIPILLANGQRINQYIGLDLTIFLCVALILQEAAGTARSTLRGELKVDQSAILEILYDVSWVVVAILFVSMGYGPIGIIYGIILARTFQVIFGFVKSRIRLSLPSRNEIFSIINYSKFSALPQVSGRVQSWMDVLMIGYFLTSSAVGAYEVAWRVTGPILLVGTAVSTTIFPQMSSWQANQDISSIEKLFTNSITPVYVLVIPSIIGGLILSDKILNIVFGAEFGQASLALIILLIGLIPRALRQVTGKTLLGLDLPNLSSKVAVIDICLNIALNLILIPRMGIVGAALGTSISLFLSTLVQYHYVSRSMTTTLPLQELGWVTFSSVIMGLCVYLITTIRSVDSLVTLSATVLFGIIVYCTTLVLNNGIRHRLIKMSGEVI